MSVCRIHGGLDFKEFFKVFDRLFTGAQGCGIFKITDVLRQKNFIVTGQRGRVFEVGARGKHRLERFLKTQRLGRIASGSADKNRGLAD